MDPLLDPRCLATTETLVVDGANGVCRVPRLGAGSGPGESSGLSLVLTVVAFASFARRKASMRLRSALLVLTLAVAALPGYWSIFAVRADRPGAVAISAQRIERLHDQIARFADHHGCAWVRTSSCVACVPIARLALTGRVCADAPVDVFADALTIGCSEQRDGSLRCGTLDDESHLGASP